MHSLSNSKGPIHENAMQLSLDMQHTETAVSS